MILSAIPAFACELQMEEAMSGYLEGLGHASICITLVKSSGVQTGFDACVYWVIVWYSEMRRRIC